MFSLESPHRGDSNEYTQYTIFNIKKKITLNYPKSAAIGFFQGTQNEFETAVVNEPTEGLLQLKKTSASSCAFRSSRVAQLEVHPTREPEVTDSIPSPAAYFRFSC